MPKKTKEETIEIEKEAPKKVKNDSTKKSSVKTKVQTKKATTKNTSTKSTSAKKKVVSKNKKINITEYYDFPIKYNETNVTILAQTPHSLFVYWNISENDINNFKKNYGKNIFQETSPILIIHNETLNYTYDVQINDFANCWYLNINDCDCKYSISLARKTISNKAIGINNSNSLVTPNDHILFEKLKDTIEFKNILTNQTYLQDISSLHFIGNIEKIYNVYDLYKKIYKEELLDLNNPSS